jgi:hypothetical protein
MKRRRAVISGLSRPKNLTNWSLLNKAIYNEKKANHGLLRCSSARYKGTQNIVYKPIKGKIMDSSLIGQNSCQCRATKDINTGGGEREVRPGIEKAKEKKQRSNCGHLHGHVSHTNLQVAASSAFKLCNPKKHSPIKHLLTLVNFTANYKSLAQA